MGESYDPGKVPYSAVVEWRELGRVLYQLAEKIEMDMNGDKADEYLFAGRDSTCNYRCAAAKNIESARHIKGHLKDLVRYLILDHENIRDEVEDLLRHPAFSDLSPSPAN